MRALFIGGTGTISAAISRQLLEEGHELYLINRGNRSETLPEGVHSIIADIGDEDRVKELLGDMKFDVVADFIAFQKKQLERDYRLFKGRCSQFIFISSASAYQKPLSDYRITEGTPLSNPYWEYSRNKIEGEEYLMKLYREEGFPVTIVRPSHTYDERSVPLGVHGDKGSYQVIKRMMEGKPVIIHGDGTSLWTMTHNSDFARGFIGLMDNIHAIGEAVQITSDESLTWNQAYEAIARALDVPLIAIHVSSEFLDASSDEYDFKGGLIGDKANTVVFDNQKLKRLVPGFTAKVRYDQGIRQTVDYILSHPECQREDLEFDAWCDAVVDAITEAAEKVKSVRKK
ncbi:nucleoside-diphosphate-sugar epimerase [Kineothrix alysoides]|uniref:Nucleoside-diphosphate-sugar epimerase n=1 Tax=Kineothrix alysoides TaxID=1469948 RepID=A0A4R1QN46_9FIRM|nr:SDR family oxidoreductase [Kineothrix alysoides]TCL55169.1 nucleoside-diphosphate-sugar epimerase [Kineothrix alysoides]